MADLLVDDDPTMRERVCMCLITIAGLADGKEAIVRNDLMLQNIKKLLDDEDPAVKTKVAALLEGISRYWMTADVLVDNDFIPLLLKRLKNEEPETVVNHLETLSNLMYCHGKEQALGLSGLDEFVSTDLFEYF